MNKIDFPTGVELPLRSGDVVVLHEFFEGCWWGRHTDKDYPRSDWIHTHWSPKGKDLKNASTCRFDIVWTPPKRKAWIVFDIIWTLPKRTVWVMWGSGENISMCFTHQSAADLAHRYQGTIQEIEEP